MLCAVRTLPQETRSLLETPTPYPLPAMNSSSRHQSGVVAKTIDPDLIAANPCLALVAAMVACLQNDLVIGIQRGWIDTDTWQVRDAEPALFHELTELQKKKNRRAFPAIWSREHALHMHLDELAITRCAVRSVHDGRLDRMVEMLNSCADGRVAFSPDLFKRRAIALAADPSAFCTDSRTAWRRAAEIRTRRTAATF